MTDPFVIIGASHAGVSLAGTLRKKGWDDGIILIERQTGTPIQRPPLSKSALKDDWPEERNYIQSAEWYEKQNLDLRTGVSVTGIDPANRTVTTDAGDTIVWSRLALATGASPRKLSCPGHDLPGVHYVRTLGDAYGLRDDLKNASSVAVVGGGYIGLEAAACMREMGVEPGGTSEDGKFTLLEVECLGACVNAPILQIDDDYYEDVDGPKTEAILDALMRGETPAFYVPKCEHRREARWWDELFCAAQDMQGLAPGTLRAKIAVTPCVLTDNEAG